MQHEHQFKNIAHIVGHRLGELVGAANYSCNLVGKRRRNEGSRRSYRAGFDSILPLGYCASGINPISRTSSVANQSRGAEILETVGSSRRTGYGGISNACVLCSGNYYCRKYRRHPRAYATLLDTPWLTSGPGKANASATLRGHRISEWYCLPNIKG